MGGTLVLGLALKANVAFYSVPPNWGEMMRKKI